MKKYYQLACMLLCWLAYASGVNAQSINSPSKEKAVRDVENRTIYAAVTGNPALDGFGMSTFKSDTPQNMTLLHPWEYGTFIFSGAAAYGEYYGFFYYYDNLGGVLPESFSKVNLRTGERTVVKDWSDVNVHFSDMTFDYSTNTMYAVGFNLGDTNLYTIDIETGNITTGPLLTTNLGNQNTPIIAATYDGRLYCMNTKGVIYQIDKETGNLTRVMDTQISLGYNQSMEFDHTDDCLYWATMVGLPDSQNELYKIDIDKKTIKSLGVLGTGEYTQACGLYIPYVLAGFDAPGAVTDLKVVPAEKGAHEAVITWKNPVKTHGGDELTGTLTVVLERDGEIISSSLGEAGAEMSWTDKTVGQGEHLYTVKVTSEVGEGLRCDMDAYVGDDVPRSLTDLKTSVGNECKTIKLEWSIPEVGAHGGYYDKTAVRYKIVRYPDKAVVEEEWEGNTYEDKSIKRLGAYYYGVTAINKAGSNKEYVLKSAIIAGKAVDVPYECSFEDEAIVTNQWSVVNANNDDNTWLLNSTMTKSVFGDYLFGASYLADPNVSTQDADEWLISPPINFEAGKKYYLSFDSRSAGVDELNLTMGKLNTIDSQTIMLESGLLTEEADEDNPVLKNYQIQLPDGVDGIYCVGINLVTMFGDCAMFQITNIGVEEGIASGIESMSLAENVKIAMAGGRLVVEGDFKTADVYDTTGVRVATLNANNAEAATAGWHPGIYIIKVANGDSVFTQKVVIK